MTPEQWQRLQDLFEEVIQEPLDQRQSILDRLEAGIHDPSLRIELRRLVEHAEVDAEFLRPVAGLGVYSEAALKTGDVVADRFEILNSIGKGGMAEVFEAFDRKLKERVAIKIIAPEFARDPALLQRFHQEVQIARRITHANVCRIHDLGEHRGQPYLSMELLEGETLSKRLERGPLPLDAWSDLADQLFQGLGAAHAAGVIHRDLKPSNLILVGSVLKILDFGLARPVLTSEDDGLTRPGTLIGTLDWMAPEQLLGEYDERSDLYSAALILVRALQQGTEAKGSGGLTGALRRATTDTEFRRQIPKSVPASWRFALLSCLERDPRERPRTVEDVQKLARSPHVLTRRLTNAVGSHWKTLAIVLGILALLGVSIRSLWYPSQSQPLRLKPGSVIMIAPTDNATRESQFDGMTSVLQADFNQSSRFNVWDSQRLSQVLGRMRLDPHTKPDVRQWHEIAVREQAPLIVFSTLSKLGDSYKFSIQCEQLGSSPDSSVAKWEETETASGPSELFEAVHRAIKRVRERAGEDATEIAAHSRLPQDITSSKWQTLELFQQAQSLSYEQRLDEAASLLRRAVQLDPNFAMGWMRLGDILNSQDKWEEGFANWRQAIALAAAQHLSEHEGLNIESRYALEIRDFKKAESALRAWTLKFPNDPLAAQLLASCLLQMGNYDESVRLARDNQQRFPVGPFGTSVLIRGLMARKEFGDIDQQITLLEKLSGKPVALGFRAMVVASRGDFDGAAALLREAVGSSDVMESSRATILLANLEADRGRFEIARQLLSDGILKDSNAGQDGFGAAKTIALAFLDGMDGKRALALARARQAVSIRRSPLVIVQAVTILARNGAVHDAAKLMDTYPSEEGPRYAADRLRMRGEVLAAQGRFQPALEVLERAAQMDRPQEPKEYYARALDLAGDHMQAKLVYQQIVNASFLTWIVEDQWPATRLLAKQYLKKSEGRVN